MTTLARPQVWAHRGARLVAPENTLAAFRRARELGADGVELDVHRTADDVLVVHHDATAPGVGVLATLTAAAIRSALPAVPTLDEVLDECVGLTVNVEIKNTPGDADHDPTCRQADVLVARLAERRATGADDDVLVSSFDLPSIDRVRALDATRRTGYLTFGVDPRETVALAGDRGHTAAHPDAWSLAVDAARTVELAERERVQVSTWTVNDADAIAAFARHRVAAVITDDPETALRALGRGVEPRG